MYCSAGLRRTLVLLLWVGVSSTGALAQDAVSQQNNRLSFDTTSSTTASEAAASGGKSEPSAEIGISFVEGSSSQVVVEREGRKYLVDLTSREIHELPVSSSQPQPAPIAQQTEPAAAQASAKPASAKSTPDSAKKDKFYHAGDDLVFNVPTGRRIDRHGLYLNFTHRFPYEAAFTGQGRGATLIGLDDFAIPSFGLRYGITSRLSVMAYRSPSIIGRPIELMAAYNFLDEHDGQPLNAAFRFSVDGQNDFANNFTENFELVLSRSFGRRAQFYATPTYSIHARPLLSNPNGSLAAKMPDQPCSAPLAAGINASFRARPCANTFSIAAALAVDIRPTVALIAEVTPTLANGTDLAIHRPEYAFGIQKKIWRHAFTFGFSNGPGSIVSERGGTRATFVQNPSADKPGGLFVGFDLTRQIF
jgi:hypothetical protein